MPKVKFGDLVKEVKNKIDRSNNPYEFYVAGDHMDSEDLRIRRKGRFATDDVGPAFIREFKKGQILYGSRRTYLKKVAVADFDGVTANTTFVLESKDNNVLLQSLLPFIMLSDGFTKWSISKSKGSTNPYILFSDLASYEFELPRIDEQRRLSELLWAGNALKESYRRAIIASDDLVKSRFSEMFGDVDLAAPKDDWIEISKLATVYSGSTPKTNVPAYWGGEYRWITPAELDADTGYVFDSERKLTKEGVDSCSLRLFPKDTVLLTSRAPIGKLAIAGTTFYCNQGFENIVCGERLLPRYVYSLLLFNVTYLQSLGRGGTFKEISKRMVENIRIPVPSLNLQQQFVKLLEQLDKSKFALTQALADLDKTIKGILNQALEA